MAKQAGPVADIVLKRVYRYGGIAHTKASVISHLSRLQRTFNAFKQSVISTGTLTTLTEKSLYNIQNEISDACDILEVTESNRKLFRAPSLSVFGAYSTTWFRDTGTRFESWKQLARDLIFIYPAKSAGSSVSVRYSKYLDALTQNTSPFELPDEEVDLVTDLAEIVVLARDKQISICREKLQQLVNKLAIDLKSARI